MNLIFAVDDRNGLMFNHRRQSRDKMVYADLLAEVGDANLYIKEISALLFESANGSADIGVKPGEGEFAAAPGVAAASFSAAAVRNLLKKSETENPSSKNPRICKNFATEVPAGDFCFIEDEDGAALESEAESIILYKWNRKYPGDLFLAIDLAAGGWKLVRTAEFAGNSHEKITKEVYTR